MRPRMLKHICGHVGFVPFDNHAFMDIQAEDDDSFPVVPEIFAACDLNASLEVGQFGDIDRDHVRYQVHPCIFFDMLSFGQ